MDLLTYQKRRYVCKKYCTQRLTFSWDEPENVLTQFISCTQSDLAPSSLSLLVAAVNKIHNVQCHYMLDSSMHMYIFIMRNLGMFLESM